jgi:hypothetical protein
MKDSISQVYPVVFMYNGQKQLAFYAGESGNLAVQEAFSEVLRNFGRSCPKTQENINYAIWKKDCLPSNERIKEDFLYNVNISMRKLVLSKFNLDLENENLFFNIKPLSMNSSLKDMTINYTSDISFIINLPKKGIDLNLEKTYNSILDKWDECKNLNETLQIKACLNNLEIDGWKIAIRNDNFFCDLTSDQNYYTGKFEPLVLKFKLEK